MLRNIFVFDFEQIALDVTTDQRKLLEELKQLSPMSSSGFLAQ